MRILKLTIAALVLSASSLSFAAGDTCGGGKITAIKEGGWGHNHFLIKIDYSQEASTAGGEFVGWIRYLDTLDADRMKGIKALAYMAFSGNKTVRAWSSGTDCSAADDITIYVTVDIYP